MSNVRAVSVLLAVGLVLAAVYLLAAFNTNSPTAAAVAGTPGAFNLLLACLVAVLAGTALWHGMFRKNI